uniref:Uncharacterized protein n=1 Tax=Strigamia maritima TaxID=126957 RepID=T1J0V9_STRMM
MDDIKRKIQADIDRMNINVAKLNARKSKIDEKNFEDQLRARMSKPIETLINAYSEVIQIRYLTLSAISEIKLEKYELPSSKIDLKTMEVTQMKNHVEIRERESKLNKALETELGLFKDVTDANYNIKKKEIDDNTILIQRSQQDNLDVWIMSHEALKISLEFICRSMPHKENVYSE